MRAEILTVGTELLIGQIVNTNAAWLAAELATLGVDLLWVTTVGDNPGRMAEALATATRRSELLVVTGGLGPTPDDLTVEAIARHLGEPLVERDEARAHVEDIFKRRNRPLSPSNYKQALFPASGELIPNPGGTALGLAARQGDCRIWAFPGVPSELKAMWADWARPQLAAASGATIRSVLLRYVGLGEAALAERVAGLLDAVNPTVAPYAGHGEVHLRVTAKAESAEAAQRMLAPVVAELSAIAPYYYGRDEETLPAVVVSALRDAGQTLAVAESCTGGLLASRLTDVPGASTVFRGGVVAYQNGIKTGVLGVEAEAIVRAGAVSPEIATALAERARALMGADWGIGVTGYAGPGPDVNADEVGLVHVAVAGPGGSDVIARRFGQGTPRETIKLMATQQALDMVRLRLRKPSTV